MPVITIIIEIQAPLDSCFDLSRDIGFHIRSLEHTNEKAVAGRTEGLIELHETVTWQAKHLGMTRRMSVRITAMDRPTHFRDEQIEGPFRQFVHDHHFEDVGGGITRMRDVITFASPFGVLGWVVDRVFLKAYLQRLIQQRCSAIKNQLESPV
ncbi:MAG: SRPBCC family protein [Planctomycetota bacterium]